MGLSASLFDKGKPKALRSKEYSFTKEEERTTTKHIRELWHRANTPFIFSSSKRAVRQGGELIILSYSPLADPLKAEVAIVLAHKIFTEKGTSTLPGWSTSRK